MPTMNRRRRYDADDDKKRRSYDAGEDEEEPESELLYGGFSKQCTSEMSRTLQTSTVYFSRVSYFFECNANDTYVLRMTHIGLPSPSLSMWHVQ